MNWPRWSAHLAGAPLPTPLPEALELLAPLMYPGKILCAGANYYRHSREMGVTDVTKENQRLFFFFKPPRNAVVAGRWWPADYRGPPLVSIEDRAAQALGLHVGDAITVSVQGVDVPARIAALRRIDWTGLGLNFAIVFSPGYIEEAPHALLASVYAPPGRDGAIARRVADALPSVTLVRVGDVIGQVSELLGKIILAIRVASLVTVAAGIAVLVGAVAASGRARRYDAVILKLLGGSRAQVLGAQGLEYALLALLLAAVALAIGGAAGWYVVTQVFALAWAPDWGVVALTLAAASATTLGIGLLGSLPALRARPAGVLRAL